MLEKDEFRFWVPIEKGGAVEKDGERYVYGVASTEDLDIDEEVVSASGLKKSLEYFLRHGRLDWDHKSKQEPKYIIGEPVDAKFDERNRMHIKGKLYKGMEIAEQAWQQLKSGNNRLGWSVGGKVLKKGMTFHKSVNKFVPCVTDVLVNHIALTPHPVNTKTYATPQPYGEFMKSLASPKNSIGTVISLNGVDYVIATRESLEKAMTAAGSSEIHTNPVVTQSLDSDIKVFKDYVRSEHYSGDPDASRQWFKSQGISDERAMAFAEYIAKNHDRIRSLRA